MIALLGLYREAEASGFSESILRTLELDAGKTRAVARAAERLVPRRTPPSRLTVPEIDDALRRALLSGYPDRVARRGKGRSLALAFGGTAELSEGSVGTRRAVGRRRGCRARAREDCRAPRERD